MIVNHNEFHSMKGHIADGCIIIAPSGKRFTLKNTLKGWTVLGDDGLPCSGYLPAFWDVEFFVHHGLSTH